MKQIPKSINRFIAGKAYKMNEIGMSGSKVLMFEDMVLKIQEYNPEVENEYRICQWLKEKLPVPEILAWETMDDGPKKPLLNWCLMTKMPGQMLCDEDLIKQPKQLMELAARGLHMLWDIDISHCPCDSRLDIKLQMARYNVEQGKVDIENTEPETFGPGGFKDPMELLQWLETHRPDEDLVLTHGDYCLPNIFAHKGQIIGFIDLGKMGIGDPWQDIAIVLRSLKHNFNGKYTKGKAYSGFSAENFLKHLGVKMDFDKWRYYTLLDELF